MNGSTRGTRVLHSTRGRCRGVSFVVPTTTRAGEGLCVAKKGTWRAVHKFGYQSAWYPNQKWVMRGGAFERVSIWRCTHCRTRWDEHGYPYHT